MPKSYTTLETSSSSSLLLPLLFDDLFSLCSFLSSHPLHSAYFLFFSPYIAQLLSFLSPVLLSTSLLFVALLTVSPYCLHELPPVPPPPPLPKFLGNTICIFLCSFAQNFELEMTTIEDQLGSMVFAPAESTSLCFRVSEPNALFNEFCDSACSAREEDEKSRIVSTQYDKHAATKHEVGEGVIKVGSENSPPRIENFASKIECKSQDTRKNMQELIQICDENLGKTAADSSLARIKLCTSAGLDCEEQEKPSIISIQNDKQNQPKFAEVEHEVGEIKTGSENSLKETEMMPVSNVEIENQETTLKTREMLQKSDENVGRTGADSSLVRTKSCMNAANLDCEAQTKSIITSIQNGHQNQSNYAKTEHELGERETKFGSDNSPFESEETAKKAQEMLQISDENAGEPAVESSLVRIRRTSTGNSRDWDSLRRDTSMRREKEWKKTLACKLYEERMTFQLCEDRTVAEGGEEMDLLWEAYEVKAGKFKNCKSKETMSKKVKKCEPEEEVNHQEEEEEEEKEEEDDDDATGQLCCLQALRLSTRKMKMGVGRPNLVKMSKFLKGMSIFRIGSRRVKKE